MDIYVVGAAPGEAGVLRLGLERLPDTGGTYLLGLHLDHSQVIRVGRLGSFEFAPGWYAYAGSAMGGVRARLARHLRATKALHWHVDYLAAYARPDRAWVSLSPVRQECAWAHALQALPGARLWPPRFGASDCRCRGHLVGLVQAPHPEVVLQLLLAARPGPAR